MENTATIYLKLKVEDHNIDRKTKHGVYFTGNRFLKIYCDSDGDLQHLGKWLYANIKTYNDAINMFDNGHLATFDQHRCNSYFTWVSNQPLRTTSVMAYIQQNVYYFDGDTWEYVDQETGEIMKLSKIFQQI